MTIHELENELFLREHKSRDAGIALEHAVMDFRENPTDPSHTFRKAVTAAMGEVVIAARREDTVARKLAYARRIEK